jgi:hypothetical protein
VVVVTWGSDVGTSVVGCDLVVVGAVVETVGVVEGEA